MFDTPQIRTLQDGEKITEPGFYAIPLEQHHSQPCDGPSITSGVLRRMEIWTPGEVWAEHALNPDRIERPRSDALRLGAAMAAYIEGGEAELAKQYMLLPPNKPNRPTAAQLANFEAGKATEAALRSIEFWAAVEEDPRDIITQPEWDLLVAMGNALVADPAAGAALGGVPEITMAWRDPATDLWCLARPDQVSFSGMLSDYKKVSMQGRPFSQRICDQRITDHGYDMQMAFAAEGFQRLTGAWPDQVGLVFQSDAPPHFVILTPIEDEDLRIGMFRNDRARRRFRECMDSGHWPQPGEHVMAYRRPEWQRTQLLEEMQTAGVAP